jgi:hypothetical protein
MALKVEVIVDSGMHAEEALGGSSRFEPLHPGIELAEPAKASPGQRRRLTTKS